MQSRVLLLMRALLRLCLQMRTMQKDQQRTNIEAGQDLSSESVSYDPNYVLEIVDDDYDQEGEDEDLMQDESHADDEKKGKNEREAYYGRCQFQR